MPKAHNAQYALTYHGRSFSVPDMLKHTAGAGMELYMPFFTFRNIIKRELCSILRKTFDCLNANWDGESLHIQKVKANQISEFFRKALESD
uniref:Uncharacterized protein n=1 Tax=Arundo donax TaxID=35708 RepID=A0A0A8ZZK5_ARUDO